MSDVHDKQTRSFNMSRIKGKNTKPEILVRKYLHAKGYRFRINQKDLPGKPDIVLRKFNTAIFINGCFWHGHEKCKYFKIPKTRSKWWIDKITSTQKRDLEKITALKESGWNVIVLWECELRTNEKREKTLSKLTEHFQSLHLR